MKVSFEGIGDVLVTFKTDDTVTPYAPVKVSENDTVSACEDGDTISGMALDVSDDGYAAVLLHGYMTASYSGNAPTFGKCALVANAVDGVKVTTATGAEKYTVVNVDTATKTVGFFI
ncbi:MAG: hypothetical protein IJ072_03310 [Oscillospiraceae bacterium]|nr:hypothetical protein [Oscillospiraceae bacterium]